MHRFSAGYDVLVPEALLGGAADAFVDLVDTYRLRSADRRTLGVFYPAR
jgi:hypothetical protein